MKHLVATVLAAGTLAMVTGCQTPAETTETVTETEVVTAETAPEPAACPVIESSNWQAFINKMPGPDAKASINVSGTVKMPLPGFTFAWAEGPLDRSAMPKLRLKLVPTAPDGMVAQVLTDELVTYKADALVTGYSGVIVSCGDTVLGEITDIPEVS